MSDPPGHQRKGTSEPPGHQRKGTSDPQEGMLERGSMSDRLGRAVGPGGVEANHSRVVAERAADTASDDIAVLSQPGVLRCCNCGLAVTPAMRLPVFDSRDAILGPAHPPPSPFAPHVAAAATGEHKASNASIAASEGPVVASPVALGGVVGEGARRLDYVRVVLEYDELRTPSFEYSSFVACTAPCALRFAYNHPSFQPSQVPHMHANMMWERHRIDEPTVAAPSGDCLAYINRVQSLRASPGDPTQPAKGASPTTGRAKRADGLSARSFYQLLANVSLQGRKQSAPGYIPPFGEEEQTALERLDPDFLQYHYQDLLPPHVAAALRLPPHLDDGGVQMDANPDSDTEADLACDVVHPPPPPTATARA